MFNIPLNHKTVFLFDHCNFFANNCGQTFEFDAINKSKHTQQAHQNLNKFKPLSKSLWSCNIEATLEYARIVYDLFPENKLIRLVVTKLETPLNSWTESEQGLDHVKYLIKN